MDTTTAAVIVIALFALIGVAAFLRFRQRGSAEIQGPFGTRLKVNGSNDPPVQAPGIQAQGITSREGGVVVEDTTGHGVNIKEVDARSDVLLSSKNPEPPSDSKKVHPPT
jgi:hypothetical protein